MSGIELALVNVGRAVVTPLFTRWLAERRADRERTSPLAELLRDRAIDELSRRRGERQIEALVDDVANRLGPLLETRFKALPPHETVAALHAVKDTFERADLSDEALFATDLNPDRLYRFLRRSAPPAAELSDLGGRLYEATLKDCSHCFVALARQSTSFPSRAAVENLERLSKIGALLSITVRNLEPTWLPPVEFGAKYADALSKKLDELELVGIETPFRTRTKLSVAYVSLAVSGDGAGPASASQWEPGTLRHTRLHSGSERVEQALARRTRTLIRGEAGAGKSTVLRWLAVTAAKSGFTGGLVGWNGRIPFLIKLRSWPDRLPVPEKFLTGVADFIVGAMPPGWVHRQLADGRGLLLVDGVDELPAERRPAVRTWVKDLLDTYPDSLVVVTSRPPAAPVRWLEAEGFESLTLERLAPTGVRSLIDQWHEAAAVSGAAPFLDLRSHKRSLLSQLAANRHLYRLAGNPLMAAVLCALNLGRKSHLPAERLGIYAAAVQMLLHRRDTERRVPSSPEMTETARLQLLQDLAWRLSVNGRSELSRDEAVEHVTRRLAAMPGVTAGPDVVLTHLVERSGVLREPAVGRIDFVHRTFQEYLAAREAAEQSMGGMLAGQAHLDTWREIVIMAAGLANIPMRAELIEGILRRADRERRHRRALILLAAACRETMPLLEPPELLAEIDSRLEELLPPRNRAEAQSLYPVGESLLGRLPADGPGLTSKRAAAVVHTIALINGQRALDTLAGFAVDGRIDVQRELTDVWRYFDPDQYARDVLHDAPLDRGRIWITEPSLLPFTLRLRHLTAMRLDCESKVDLGSLHATPKLTSLRLIGGWKGSTAELAKFDHLQALLLGVDRPITVADVRPLAELAELHRLWLYGDGIEQDAVDALPLVGGLADVHLAIRDDIDVSALAGMTGLRMLDITGNGSGSLRGLPATELPGLSLGYLASAPDDDATALPRSFPMLTELHLYGSNWPEDLGFVGDFPRLEWLSLDHAMTGRLGGLRAPATLRQVDLGFTAEVDLTALTRLPQLQTIGLGWIEQPVDLTPLRAWAPDGLTIAANHTQRLSHRDELPPTVRIRRHDTGAVRYE